MNNNNKKKTILNVLTKISYLILNIFDRRSGYLQLYFHHFKSHLLLLLWFFSVLWSNSSVCVLYVSKLLTSTSTVQINLNLLNCIDSPQANIIKSVLNLFCTERHFNFYSFKSHANIIQISKVICLFVFILQFNSMFGRDILPMQKKKKQQQQRIHMHQ